MKFEYITDRIRNSPQFTGLVDKLKKGGIRIGMSGLSGTRRAFWISALTGRGYRPVVVISGSAANAGELAEDLKSISDRVLYYPSLQPILYNDIVHSMEAEEKRIKVLDALITGSADFVVSSVDALLFPVMPADMYKKNTRIIKAGETVRMEEVIKGLIQAGYEREEMVEGPGQFSLRGGILDIFPVGYSPCRIEYFGDQVDSIRLVDISTQRSVEKVNKVRIPPCRELLVEQHEIDGILENLDTDLAEMAERLRAAGCSRKAEELEDEVQRAKSVIETGAAGQVLKNYWMYGCRTASFFEYLDKNCLVVLDNPVRVEKAADGFYTGFLNHFSDRMEKGKALRRQQDRIYNSERFYSYLDEMPVVDITDILRGNAEYFGFSTRTTASYHGKLPLAVEEIDRLKREGYLVGIIASSNSRTEIIAEELKKRDIYPVIVPGTNRKDFSDGMVILDTGVLREGFLYPEARVAVFTDSDIFGTSKKKTKAAAKAKKEGVELFTDLVPGDYVVHENHGIGIYRGIRELKVEGIKRDYLKIEYRGGDMLYLPTYQSHLIQRYIGAEDKRVRISRMGGKEWARTKAGVKGAIENMARELLRLYASREAVRGYAFGRDTVWQNQFDDLFPFEETPDQVRCIDETKKDMERQRPMDRLLCGDVGYGKTEVAMRAAFKAVMDGKQVAMLVPTTILAQQHFNTFTQRMEQFPINIEMISRFRTAGQQQRILKKLREGNIDIIIGTHRLLQRDVLFRDLGLLIVDEEQRFGVLHKETIKELKKSIDVLTLTATPIPRTLHMSMVGIRDMSVLLDPPEDRFPVETYIVEYNDQLIRDAVLKELDRNGQVYFVHNRVNSIEKMARELNRLVPEASVGIAHGQMDERNLERVMVDFLNRRYDILLCTTIIENGLDMPNVNTIIVTDSDRLGLAQMYQLRGRVGRSNRLAYAYFTYRKNKVLTEAAEKRLKAIKEFTEFGSGFKIAMRDLEIRGAGNILGHEQHGHMMTVGYDMYCKLLDQTVREIRGLPVEEKVETLLDIKVDAYIPKAYIRDEKQKVEVYKKIASIESEKDYSDVLEEIMDRFGEPADPVLNLLVLAYIKHLCQRLGIAGIEQKNNIIRVRFTEKAPLRPEAAARLLNEYPGKIKFEATACPSFTFKTADMDFEKLLALIKAVLEKIICFNKEQITI